MYFMGTEATDARVGTGAYANGARVQSSSSHVGTLTEALDHAYRVTGRADIRDRLVAIARYIDQHGIDSVYQYTGSSFGIVNGVTWHNYRGSSPTATFWDPVYTISLVNTLVRGFKYTGDSRFYDRAKYFFNRGTKGVYGSPTQRTASDNQVHHFVDTRFDSSTGSFYLSFNKGELQYTYLLFERQPPVLSTIPNAPSNLSLTIQ
jgi:hypothetical protein